MAGKRRKMAARYVSPAWWTVTGSGVLNGAVFKEDVMRRITLAVLAAVALGGLAVTTQGSFVPPWAASTLCSQCHNFA